MAVVLSQSATYTSVTATMSGLTYQGQLYGGFEYDLYMWDGVSGWVYQRTEVEYPYDHWGQYSISHTFTNLNPNTYYSVVGWAQYSGTWYDYNYDHATYSLTPVIPSATISNGSTQKTTITFDYTNTVGSLALYVWSGIDWVGIASSGLQYTTQAITNGTRITITNLVPNVTWYFYARTYVGNSYSASATVNYTTQAFPTTTAPTLSGRVEGGYSLAWGDNGYEGSGFGYSIRIDGGTSYGYTGHSTDYYTYDYGVSHSFDVCVQYNGYVPSGSGITKNWYISGNWTSANSFVTAPKTPTGITIGTVTTTSIQVTATGMSGTYFSVEFRVYSGSTLIKTITTANGILTTTITGLIAGTTYNIRCYGYGGSPGYVYSVSYFNKVQATTAPPTLAQPSFSSFSNTSKAITFVCATVTNATWYDVSLYKAGVWQTNFAGSTPRSGTFDNLTHGTAYTVTITVEASGYTSNSRTYNFTTNTLGTPTAPTSVSFTQSGSTQFVSASWVKGSNTTRMDIDMSSDNVNWGSIDWPSQQLDSYTLDTGYTGQHYFRLRPINYDGYNTVYGSWTSGYSVVFVTGNTFIYNGSSWVAVEGVYTYNGSSWVKSTDKVKTYNGSAWV